MQVMLIILGVFISFFCGMLSLAMLIVFVAKGMNGYDLVHRLARNMPRGNRVRLIKDLFTELE